MVERPEDGQEDPLLSPHSTSAATVFPSDASVAATQGLSKLTPCGMMTAAYQTQLTDDSIIVPAFATCRIQHAPVMLSQHQSSMIKPDTYTN